MGAKGLQGADAPVTVVRPAGKGLVPPPVEDFSKPGDVIVTPDNRYPTFAVAMWLISPKGKGRHSLHADHQGRVRPNISIIPIHVGTPGVSVSKRDDTKLDLEEFWIIQLSRGFVRVDHLKDANGEPLGLPDLATRRGGDSYTAWCNRVLDPARLKQLHAELGAAEGRGLLTNWKPDVPNATRKALMHPGRKEPARRTADLETLKKIVEAIEAIAKIVREVASGKPN